MNIIQRIKKWFKPKPLWLVTLTFERPYHEPKYHCYLTREPPYHLTIGQSYALGYLTRIDFDSFGR